jgi:hypothetical protein
MRKTQYFTTPKWDGTYTIEARQPGKRFDRFEGFPSKERAEAWIREQQIADAYA